VLLINSKPVVSIAIGYSICTIGDAVRTISVSVGDAIYTVAVASLLFVSDSIVNGWVGIIVAKVQTKTSRIDVAVAEEQQRCEHRLGQKIENTVEDGLRVW
jgi:hypothetical protein